MKKIFEGLVDQVTGLDAKLMEAILVIPDEQWELSKEHTAYDDIGLLEVANEHDMKMTAIDMVEQAYGLSKRELLDTVKIVLWMRDDGKATLLAHRNK